MSEKPNWRVVLADCAPASCMSRSLPSASRSPKLFHFTAALIASDSRECRLEVNQAGDGDLETLDRLADRAECLLLETGPGGDGDRECSELRAERESDGEREDLNLLCGDREMDRLRLRLWLRLRFRASPRSRLGLRLGLRERLLEVLYDLDLELP